MFFLFNPMMPECSRIRKSALFLMSDRLKKHKNLHPQSFKNGVKTYWKLRLFEGQLWFFISYLSEMKRVSMSYNSSLLKYFSQLVSIIFLLWRYITSSTTGFSDILLRFPNDLNSHAQHIKTYQTMKQLTVWPK